MDTTSSKRKKKKQLKQLPKKKFSREEVIEILFDDDYFDSDETNSGDSEDETRGTPKELISSDKTRTAAKVVSEDFQGTQNSVSYEETSDDVAECEDEHDSDDKISWSLWSYRNTDNDSTITDDLDIDVEDNDENYSFDCESIADEQSTEASEDDQSTEEVEDNQGTEASEDDQSTEEVEDGQGTEASEDDQSTEEVEDDQGTEASEDDQSTEEIEDDQATEASEDESCDASDEEASDIFTACEEGNLAKVIRLVKKDKSLLKSVNGRGKKTPLHIACSAKRTSIVKFLLNKGAEVNACDTSGNTPLNEAVHLMLPKPEIGNPSGKVSSDLLKQKEVVSRSIVRMLLDAGADASKRKNGYTALFMFVHGYFNCQKGSGKIPKEIIKMLLEGGAQPKKEMSRDIARLAVRYGEPELLELCFQYGADVDDMRGSGKSLLHVVLDCHSEEVSDELKHKTLEYLLDKGCTGINQSGEGTLTPLCCAARCGYLKCIDLLLKRGAKIEIEQPLPIMAWSFVGAEFERDFSRYYTHTISGARVDTFGEYREIFKEVIRRGSVLDLETDSGLQCLMFLLVPVGFPIAHYSLETRIKRAVDFMNIVLQENALKFPSCRGLVLYMEQVSTGGAFWPLNAINNLPVLLPVYQIGYKVSGIEAILEDSNALEEFTEEQQKILNKIENVRFRIPSLQEVCKYQIRKSLGSPISPKILELPVTKFMQDYVGSCD